METIKRLVSKREQWLATTAPALCPMKSSQDILSLLWAHFYQNGDKQFEYDKIQLCVSASLEKEIKSKMTSRIASFTRQISFVEYQPNLVVSFQNLLNKKVHHEQYHSPYYIQAVDMKGDNFFDMINVVDLISSVLFSFQGSQQLAAHNLWNLYIGEDLRDILPLCIINSTFT